MALAVCSAVAQENDPLPPQDPPVEPAKPEAGTRLEAVIVTANKREQALTDVPMSISAVSGKDLERNGDKTFADYALTVPSLDFGWYGEGRQRISIRGLQAPTGVATVAYLIDGIDQSDNPPDAELFDIDHIEVLRGPQGTLYGAGAVGGAIKILTNRANPYAFQAKANGAIGYSVANAIEHDENAMVNLPLIRGELGLRVVGFNRHSDGFITVREPNWNNPPPFKSYSDANIVREDANTNAVKGGRVALDWKATNDVSVGVTYSTQQRHAGYGVAESIDTEAKYGGYQVLQGSSPLVNDSTVHDYRQTSFDLKWKLPFAQLESVTGTADVKEDLDSSLFIILPVVDTVTGIVGVPLPIPVPQLPAVLVGPLQAAGLPTEAAIGDMFNFRVVNQYSYVSQELRLVSLQGGPLTWTAGLFYKLEAREAFNDVFAGPNLAPVFGDLFQQVSLHFDTEEYAAYGQLEYAITDAFTALAGVRYYIGELTDRATGAGADGEVFNPKYHDVSPKFTLSYHLTDHALAYASAAKGFRVGGVNFATIQPPPPELQRIYDPDVLWNYELGLNSTLLDGRVSANFAVFTSIWKNLQDEVILHSDPSIDLSGLTPANPTGFFQSGGNDRMVINAGRAHSRGIEGELTALLPFDLTWTLSGAHLDAAVDQEVQNPATGGVIPKGTRLENVPRFAGATTLVHDLRFAGGWGLASSVMFQYRGHAHSDITNPTESVAPAYRLLNLRVGIHGAGRAWSTDFFVNNLFDERASSFTFNHSGTSNTIPDHTDMPLPRRTLGVRLNYTF